VFHGSFRELLTASLHCRDQRLGIAWPLLEYGRYTAQIERYFTTFPRSQINISYYEELQRSPQPLLASLFAFLGVDPDFVPDLSQRHHEPAIPRLNRLAHLLKKSGAWPYLRRLAPVPLGGRLRSLAIRSRGSLQMLPADREFLTDYYRDDIAALAALLDHDFSLWLDTGGPARASVPG
jgi:hypothetical protein